MFEMGFSKRGQKQNVNRTECIYIHIHITYAQELDNEIDVVGGTLFICAIANQNIFISAVLIWYNN